MREKLIELLKCDLLYHSNEVAYWGDEHIGALADHLITNGVVVREKGEWTTDGFCEFCKEEVMTEWDECGGEQKKTNFCPNCGADMRKGENDEP